MVSDFSTHRIGHLHPFDYNVHKHSSAMKKYKKNKTLELVIHTHQGFLDIVVHACLWQAKNVGNGIPFMHALRGMK